MKINVGSKNNVKIDAVKEIINNYDFFKNTEVEGIDVSSDVSEQPISLDETVLGAIYRSKNAFNNCKYSFGLESGLIKIPYSKTGYMNITVCSIYDGKENYLGISSAYEYPSKVTKLVFEEKLDINEAFYKAGLTNDKKCGNREGAIGILTNGRIDRKEYTKQAISMSLIHLEKLCKNYG